MGSLLLACILLTSCQSSHPPDDTVVVLIDSSPNNLDLRIGTDAQSERIGGLLFDPLVRKDDHFNLQPWLATSWQQPDPLTWIFHLRNDVAFQNGEPLTSEDVAFTIRSLIDGSLITPKSGAFAAVVSVDTPDPLTVTLHLKHPDESLLFNLSDGLFGVVPRGSGKDFGLHPIGSGPFRFISATQDKDVLVERNPNYWAGPVKLNHVRFAVVPDAVTSALELKKGSADIGSNMLTLDMVHALTGTPGLQIETGPGAPVLYLNFNVTAGPLRDRRVRQAIACAMDRPAIIHAIWRDQARPADTLLPPGHWAAADPATLPQYPHNLARAKTLLADAGYGRGLHLEMKISTDETTRLLAIVLQQQLRAAGIDLTLRSAEFGTFYADVTRGAFQMYALKWIGSNEDPDIFRYAYATDRVPPKGGNRGHYSNPHLDTMLSSAASTPDEATRRRLYLEAQQILADDLPTIPLWFPNNEVVHTTRITHLVPQASGSFDFLRKAELQR